MERDDVCSFIKVEENSFKVLKYREREISRNVRNM